MITHEQYIENEKNMVIKKFKEIQSLPTREKIENYNDLLHNMKNQPYNVAQSVLWVLNGSYGIGAQSMVLDVLKNARKSFNRVSYMTQFACALEHNCTEYYIRKAYNQLNDIEKETLNNMVNNEIEYYFEEYSDCYGTNN